MDEARAALGDAQGVVDTCVKRFSEPGSVDANQVVAYDLAHAAAAVACAKAAANYGDRGETEVGPRRRVHRRRGLRRGEPGAGP